MLTVSESAGARLARKLVNKQAAEDVANRFVRDTKRKGWTIRLDHLRPNDATFAHDGRTVLLLDEQASHSLRNKMLDIKETDEGPRLRFRS